MKKDSYDTIYNRHIRKARAHAKHSTGMERARLIANYFAIKTNHPLYKDRVHQYVQYTYEELMKNRYSDYTFPSELMKQMASLCAENECL